MDRSIRLGRQLEFHITLCALTALAASCMNPNGGPPERPIRMLEIRASESGLYGPSSVPLRLAIYDEGSLAKLRFAHLEVDFEKEMVLLACLGRDPTGSHEIQIGDVWVQGHRVFAPVKIIWASESDPAPLKPTRPYHWVIVDRSEFNVDGYEVELPASKEGAKLFAR